MRRIALEGRPFVLSANQFACRSAYPPDCPVGVPPPDEVLIAGVSCLVDPFGEVLAGDEAVVAEAARRGVELVALPTDEACAILSEADLHDTAAILHVTC